MLIITIPSVEVFDETTDTFKPLKEETYSLEHSLVSVSKWESKWRKPFLAKSDKTNQETMDYIRCMMISQNPTNDFYTRITNSIIDQITDYINAPMTATWFNDQSKGQKSREVITSEIIYYWMISLNIPMECQKWHLHRLLTLIHVCNIKNTRPKRMDRKTQMSNQRALNEARRNQFNTKG